MTLSLRFMSRPSWLLVPTSSLLVENVTSKSSMPLGLQYMKHHPSLYLPGCSTSRFSPPSLGAKYRPRWPGSTIVVAHPDAPSARPTRALASAVGRRRRESVGERRTSDVSDLMMGPSV